MTFVIQMWTTFFITKFYFLNMSILCTGRKIPNIDIFLVSTLHSLTTECYIQYDVLFTYASMWTVHACICKCKMGWEWWFPGWWWLDLRVQLLLSVMQVVHAALLICTNGWFFMSDGTASGWTDVCVKWVTWPFCLAGESQRKWRKLSDGEA